jgi:preprotein translocase subunit YajC
MFNLFFNEAVAQEAAKSAAAQPNPMMSLAPFVIIFVIFYFLMIKPQKKKMEEEKKLLDSLNKGDEVYTKSGMIGSIYGLTDLVVTLDVGDNTKIKFLRTQIAGLTKTIFEKKEKKDDKK